MYYPNGDGLYNQYEPLNKQIKVITTSTEKYDAHNNLIGREVVTVTEEIIDQVIWTEKYKITFGDVITGININSGTSNYANTQNTTYCLQN